MGLESYPFDSHMGGSQSVAKAWVPAALPSTPGWSSWLTLCPWSPLRNLFVFSCLVVAHTLSGGHSLTHEITPQFLKCHYALEASCKPSFRMDHLPLASILQRLGLLFLVVIYGCLILALF